jgi:DedD protein
VLLRGVEPGTNPETITYYKAEQTRYCGSAAATRPQPSRSAPAATQTAPPKPGGAPASTGRLTIQAGAFRELSGAQSVKQQLERAGFTDIRLVRVPGNQLIRVRIGRFADRAAAAQTLARLASADISAVLVSDAHTETPVKN